MIVKKTPIPQGYPDPESFQALSRKAGISRVSSPVFYDIETTGLSRSAAFCYLIGAAVYEDGWQLYQWLAASQAEEREVLLAFSAFLAEHTCTVQYNGNSFDQPYLEHRFALHNLNNPFEGMESLDLFVKLKPLKALLKLENRKQPQLEAFLGAGERIFCDGGECIRLYRRYLSHKEDSLLQTLLGHNLEDVLGLGRIFGMLSYLCLLDGDYQAGEADFDGEHLLLSITLPLPLPAQFSNGNEAFYITGQEREVRLAVKACDGKVRQYFKNYRDYFYLPAEDTAIPKVLGEYLDKSLRTAARKETCYTWFDCRGDFLKSPEKQLSYLRNSLEVLIGMLK